MIFRYNMSNHRDNKSNKIAAPAGGRRAPKAPKVLIVACAALVFALALGLMDGSSAMAATTQQKLDQAKKEKAATESSLKQTKANIQGMEGAKSNLQGQLSNLNSELSKISDNLDDLEAQIKDKEQEIEETIAALEEAEETAANQYSSMKKRIKFIYERQNNAYIELLFTGGIGEFLNRSQYVEKLSEYDHRMLENYKENQRLIEQKKEELITQKEELDEYQKKVMEEQSRVSGLVKNTAGNIAAYADQISAAEGEAMAYEAQIAQQEENIKALQKQLEEEKAKSRLAANSKKRNISEVTFAEDDRYLLANLIYCEAGAEPYAGKVGVGAVVINRLLSSVFPDTMVGVIYQNKQFSPVASGRLAAALASNKATSDCYAAADEAMKGYTNVGGCVFFRTPIPGLTGQQIGGHIFY